LIPVLLIPQLILSGVVVKFDKLNPVIGNTATVPFVGDLMASRWAFEAAMVAQYKDNKFERQFYPYDKVMAESDFKKIYYIPALETKLAFVNLNSRNAEPGIQKEVESSLELIRNEITRELASVNKKDFASMDKLVPGKYDSAAFQETSTFLEAMKKFYVNRYNGADREKEKMVTRMTSSAEKEKEFEALRQSYQNEAITELVKNMAETNRIIEKDGRLVQKFYPVYKDPEPDHIVDFDAQFYMPAKHFLNQNIDTFFFNIGVIWSMTMVLAIALYYEILKKIVDGLSNISNPLPKRM
jgi:Skp family chaperone for outer membrane proteins